MVMPIRPADGLVTRLLQQQTSNHSGSGEKAPAKETKPDQVSISSEARNPYKQQDLESQLLQLYTRNHTSEG